MSRRLTYLFSFFLAISVASEALADLVGHWRFDEGSGTIAYDSSGNGNDGTFNGAPQWVVGHFGGALEFDGSDDYVAIGDLDLTGSFTLTFWMRPSSLAGGWHSVVMKEYDYGFEFDGTNLLARVGNGAGGWGATVSTTISTPAIWYHAALTWSGSDLEMFIDASRVGQNTGTHVSNNNPLLFGSWNTSAEFFNGIIDDVRIYNHALTEPEIRAAMEGGKGYPYALGPKPADGALHADTWVSLSWRPGDFAVSHDVYLGDSFDDVNNGTGGTFRGNQASTFYVAGFPGFPYPDGLVPGTTYYWRIDEVNVAEPNSPWKGPVWSFSIPPRKAYNPVPADGAEFIDVNVKLSWTAGFGAKLHTVYFGTDFDTVANAAGGLPQGPATYSPSGLKPAKTYYWRVDEFDGAATHKGDVWSFTTRGAIGNPNPANGAVGVNPTQVLTWRAGDLAASHEVYFGKEADAVKNATKASPEYKGTKARGDESYNPGKLTLLTTYHWRVDEVNSVNPDSPWKGNVWSFTTGDFFVLDDFEDYDGADNQIWYSWHDGLGYGTPQSPPYFAGNGTGAAVGDENTASFTEETIVHGGGQSMPLNYDNNKQSFAKYSEAELTLTAPRDWTEEGVGELSLWFRGRPASVGGFVEAPGGTCTMTATGADIWNQADQFHYAFKMLTGVGTIEAQVLSVGNTDPWAKAGVMIRETLDAGSKFAAVYITPGNGCRFQARADTAVAATSDTAIATTQQIAIKAPYWVKLERDVAGNFRGYYSSNGTTWTTMSWNPQNITMGSNVYIGLALTSHNANATCTAKFSNVRTTGTVSAQWANQDIGIASNAAEPLYVAVSNSAGQPAVVVHSNTNATTITTWTEWVIPLQSLADKGINLKNVDRIAIGLGTRGNMTTPGGSGKMYFDDIRLYRPRAAP